VDDVVFNERATRAWSTDPSVKGVSMGGNTPVGKGKAIASREISQIVYSQLMTPYGGPPRRSRYGVLQGRCLPWAAETVSRNVAHGCGTLATR
jgi:hypothetical protein